MVVFFLLLLLISAYTRLLVLSYEGRFMA
ncbi:hypothetical protein LINGRAHAP2_LOCUS34620 [Linum grandiflorum]